MFERLLEPGCTESPACQCGGEMNIAAIEKLPQFSGSDRIAWVHRAANVVLGAAFEVPVSPITQN